MSRTEREGPSAALRARVLDEAARTPSRTRADQRKRATLVSGIGVAVTALLFFATGGFYKGARPVELLAFTGGLGLVGAAALTRLATGVGDRSPSMLGRPRGSLLGGCVLLVVALALVALVAAILWPASASEQVPGSIDVACAALTLVQGTLPLLFFVLPRRGSDPVHPAISGAAVPGGRWPGTRRSRSGRSQPGRLGP